MIICDCCYTQLPPDTVRTVTVVREVTCCAGCRAILVEKADELLAWMVTGRVGGAAWTAGMTLEQVARVGAWFNKADSPVVQEPTLEERKEIGLPLPPPPGLLPCFSCSATGKVRTTGAVGVEVTCPACAGTKKINLRSILPDPVPLPTAGPTFEDRKDLGVAVASAEQLEKFAPLHPGPATSPPVTPT